MAATGAVSADSGTSKDCMSSEFSNSSWTTVQAEVTQPPNTTGVVRINYSSETISSEFIVDTPPNVNVTDKNGFVKDRWEYRYTGSQNPYIKYELPERDFEGFGIQSSQWTLSPLPVHHKVNINYNVVPAGIAGDEFLLLGNYSKYTTTVDCQEISLIVSKSANLKTRPDKILGSLQYTAENLDVGHNYDQVRLFTIPTQPEPEIGGRTSNNEAWITTKDLGFQNITSVAIHEYVHTRQAFDAAGITEMLWFTEASASYYQNKFAYETGAISGSVYNTRLENGSRLNDKLGNQSEWRGKFVQYRRGFAYVAILDHKLKSATNGTYSVEDMMREINRERHNVSSVEIRRDTFISRIHNSSNKTVATWADQAIDSDRTLNYSSAKVERKSLAEIFQDRLEKRLDEDPYAGLGVAMLFGFGIGILVVEWQSDDDDTE